MSPAPMPEDPAVGVLAAKGGGRDESKLEGEALEGGDANCDVGWTGDSDIGALVLRGGGGSDTGARTVDS